MLKVKEKITEVIQSLPDNATYEEIMRELAFEKTIERGLADSRSGRIISNEDMERRIRTEYRQSDFGKLERGKYYKRVMASSNVVVLDVEVAALFPNSASVNKALHSLVEAAHKASGAARRTAGRGKRRSG